MLPCGGTRYAVYLIPLVAAESYRPVYELTFDSGVTMIEIEGLSKRFDTGMAVDDLNFSVGPGEVLGFLGPNGAGKSTTMKMITGFLRPTSGTVRVNGFDVQSQPLQAKRQIGYLPEGAPGYGEMTVLQFLEFIADIRGLKGQEREKAASIRDS